MVLKLYGYPLSTCTRLVAAVLKEKEIAYEFYPVDLAKREQKAASYLKYQPFGQVPYIVRCITPSSAQALTHDDVAIARMMMASSSTSLAPSHVI